jgi:hypothetical protein
VQGGCRWSIRQGDLIVISGERLERFSAEKYCAVGRLYEVEPSLFHRSVEHSRSASGQSSSGLDGEHDSLRPAFFAVQENTVPVRSQNGDFLALH